jgi:hypothetical protein
MIRCPTFGTVVPTGLTTEKIKFESLSGVVIPLRCPDCMQLHKWEQKEAWEKRTHRIDQVNLRANRAGHRLIAQVELAFVR